MECSEFVKVSDIIKDLNNNALFKKEESKKMFLARYTEDYGKTAHTVLVNADNITDAYVKVDLKLQKNGAITDLFEII